MNIRSRRSVDCRSRIVALGVAIVTPVRGVALALDDDSGYVPAMSLLRTRWPIVQAPMAGVSTPALAAAVSNAGGLGSIAIGAVDVDTARTMIRDVRRLTTQPFNVNVFTHATPTIDLDVEQRWLDALAPVFAQFGATPPTSLRTIYTSFVDDDAMLAMLLEERPPIVSLHFGLPRSDTIAALKNADITVIATATNVDEAAAIDSAGLDGIVAQGSEAGGHRGVFDMRSDVDSDDDMLSTIALTRALVARTTLPVIAAGGIMDGADIAAVLDVGAVAAQLGTAFVLCPESSADASYRAAFHGPGTTTLTTSISGRPARCLVNRFTALRDALALPAVPAYPRAYDVGKALNAAATARGAHGFGAQWAGTGASRARAMPAATLIATLVAELDAARR